MLILSHRGYWTEPKEKNTPVAFHRSFDSRFGVETDIRDCCGHLVISHDIPIDYQQMFNFRDFLKIYDNSSLPLALNIKADGLAAMLKNLMQKVNVVDWFAFDMSIPDTRAYLREKIPVFIRMSEVEREPAWVNEAEGIWLDSFSETWYNLNLITTLIQKNLRVCVVSPELHGREHMGLWAMLRSLSGSNRLLLCTDFPEKARIFFGENK